MQDPRVSIIVPVYNGSNYMRDAIDSALSQTWANTEVVVVNDGSRDDGATQAIARSYGDRIVFVDKPNGGVASALNAGLQAMTGEIFCWLSHDDRHHPEKTAIQVQDWVANGSRPEVLFSNYRLIDAQGSLITDVALDHEMLTRKPLYPLLRGSVHGCSVFIPKAIFDDVGGFDEALPTTQDYDLWRRMIARYPFRHMPRVLIDSRWHDEQGSKKIDHIQEATQFWLATVKGIDRQEKVRHEGNPTRFDLATADFLAKNNLTQAAETLREEAFRAIDDVLISVVMPVFNRVEQTLGALDSLKRQTHPTWELIVVDDGSTEDMSLLKAAVEALGPRARYVRQDNAGPGAARNNGWGLAKGDYVAFLDSDDLFLPAKLKSQLRRMEEEDAAFSQTSYFRHWRGRTELVYMASGEGNAFPEIIGSCGIATPTVMLRRSLFDEGLKFETDIHLGEDVCLWLSLAGRYGVLGIASPLSIVRASPDAAAYDKGKALQGIDNILRYIMGDEVLRAHTAQLEQLQGFRRELISR
ncbi:glycosyltransferase family 2 protein [Bosea sp. NPDC055353]